jgi:hypothetical protein
LTSFNNLFAQRLLDLSLDLNISQQVSRASIGERVAHGAPLEFPASAGALIASPPFCRVLLRAGRNITTRGARANEQETRSGYANEGGVMMRCPTCSDTPHPGFVAWREVEVRDGIYRQQLAVA